MADQKGYRPDGVPPYQGAPYPPEGGGYPQQGGGYPQQGGGYPQQGAPPPYPGSSGPAPYPQSGAVHHQTVIVAPPMRFGETPINLRCHFCHADIVTGTHYDNGLGVWLVAGICCFTGLWLGCCLIPFCVDSLKDVVHTCPNCKRQIGKYQRLS